MSTLGNARPSVSPTAPAPIKIRAVPMNHISPRYFNGTRLLRGVVLPSLVASLALAIAFFGAFLIRGSTEVDGVNFFVETLSGRSSSFVVNLGIVAPLGFAFVAGTASAFNPCGFVMLPAYMGLYLSANDNEDKRPIAQQLGKALLVSGIVTGGFVLLFATVGTLIGVGVRSVGNILPWLGLAVGVLLTIAGAWMLGGGKLYTPLATQMASHMGNPLQTNVRGYFLFGLAYGIASLSCTLPIFLAVVGTSFVVSSVATSFAQFVLYAAGMGSVIIVLTLGTALFKGSMASGMRRALPYIQPVGTWLMVLAGTYIVFYWLTLGGLLDGLS